MDKYIMCYDEKTYGVLCKYFEFIIKNNDTYIFQFNEEKLSQCLSEYGTLDYQISDNLILEF